MSTTKRRINISLTEDQAWETIAKKRDTKAARYLSHKKAWR